MNGCSRATQPACQGSLRTRNTLSIDVFDDQPLNGRKTDGQLLCHSFLADDFAAQHLNLAGAAGEITGPTVDRHHGHCTACLENVKVVAQGAVGGVHDGLEFSVAQTRPGLKRRENTTAKRVLVGRRGTRGDPSKRHGAHRTGEGGQAARDADHAAGGARQPRRQPGALSSPLSEQRHEVGLAFSSLNPSLDCARCCGDVFAGFGWLNSLAVSCLWG